MSRALTALLAVTLLLGMAVPVSADEPPVEVRSKAQPALAAEIIPGEVVVKWRDDRTPGRRLAVMSEMPGRAVLVSTEGRGVHQVVAELSADPSVEYAEPNYVVRLANEGSVTAVDVNDPKTGDQYALDHMRVRDAWSRTKGGSSVIALLDTGVQANHPDLAGRVLPGRDFVNDDSNAADDNGHGTWVAGIVAANTNDGYGIAGVSWTDKILPVKMMNADGTGNTSDLAAAITWAADNGADVINMSIGGFPYSQSVQNAVNYAWNKGVVLLGAAGNNGIEQTFYPASFSNVISVSATQVDDEFSNWSSFGPQVDVSAPGSSILTTNCTVCPHASWGSHTYISGTSFATPNAAGVVALIRAYYPDYSATQVVNRLFSTVDDLGYAGWDKHYGRGRVNAYRALGGGVAASGIHTGDAAEPNNTLASARPIALNTTVRPSVQPAGDIDVFAVDISRAGRLDVRVSGVVDTRAYPWHRSGLPIDPILELYTTGGTLLKRVDNEWESGVELASIDVTAGTRILVRIRNWYANGNRTAYSLTPTFVDNVPPAVIGRTPAGGAVNVAYDGSVTVDFSEPVSGVSGSSVQLRDAASNVVAATVSYASSTRRATLRPKSGLAGDSTYRVSLTSAIKDVVGGSLTATSWTFTTGKAAPRLAGADRYATAVAVSRSAFGPGIPVVYIATGSSYPDALAGAPAARAGGGPLLLTARTFIPDDTAAELTRLKPGRIVVLGGSGVVSTTVFNTLKSYTSGGVTRIAGADRYATAAKISRVTFPDGAATVYVATATTFADALAAGAAAAGAHAPILLVSRYGVPSSTLAELTLLDPDTIFVMGGTGAVSDAVVTQLGALGAVVQRIHGPDRFATAVELSKARFPDGGASTVYVGAGMSFPDGLAAGPVAGASGAPLLLVPTGSLPGLVADELRRLGPAKIVILGGPNAVSDAVRTQIRALWP